MILEVFEEIDDVLRCVFECDQVDFLIAEKNPFFASKIQLWDDTLQQFRHVIRIDVIVSRNSHMRHRTLFSNLGNQ